MTVVFTADQGDISNDVCTLGLVFVFELEKPKQLTNVKMKFSPCYVKSE